MNKENLKNRDDVDMEKVNELQKKIVKISTSINEIFFKEWKDNPETAIHLMHAVIYSPLSFVLNLFEEIQKQGLDPCKEFPAFINVYSNFTSPLLSLKSEWKENNFPTFIKRFQEEYGKLHYVWESE